MTHRIEFSNLVRKVKERHLGVHTHSGDVTEGSVFVIVPAAMPKAAAANAPGNEVYLEKALAQKPGAVVCESRLLPLLDAVNAPCDVAVVEDVRLALGALARASYGTDERCPKVVGITGTNGKTTETYLMEALYRALGHKVGVIGTVSYRWPGHEEDAPLTTPNCLMLHSMLAQMAAAGADIAFMEVSSHALDQERIAGIDFSVALLTNVTQDHLDYHSDMEEYFQAKRRLFLDPGQGGVPETGKLCVLNADDEHAIRILQEKPGAFSFGLGQSTVPTARHLQGEVLSLTPEGVRLRMRFESDQWDLSSPLVGGFNVMNLLGAQALGLALGLTPEDFAALSTFNGVSGRLERVPGNKRLNVFVDYAHTPDALIKAITALRDAGFKRIVTVFGCGGNRDRTKRPIMGEAVARLTDIAVLTSDNPRDEDPRAIMDDVLPGLVACKQVVQNPDRRAALAEAVAMLGPEDALLVAGKGHETYQLIKGVKHPFSDQEILRELMA